MTDWKSLALWLADCAAATAEYDGRLKSTSAARSARMRGICWKAAMAIEGRAVELRARQEADILRRLKAACLSDNFPTPDTKGS